MSLIFKYSGKTFALPDAAGGWEFTPRPGGWLIAKSPDGRRIRIAASKERGKLGVWVDGHVWNGDVAEKVRGSAGAGAGVSDLTAQFPGKVRKVLVSAGAEVKAGDPLVLLEAMKMEFAVKAPFAAKVAHVLVQEGQQLSPGDLLVDLKPEGGSD